MTLLKLGLGHFRSQFSGCSMLFQWIVSNPFYFSFRKTFLNYGFWYLFFSLTRVFPSRIPFIHMLVLFSLSTIFFFSHLIFTSCDPFPHSSSSLPPKIFGSMIWSTISLPPQYLQTILHQPHHWPDLPEIWLSPRTGHVSQVRGFSSLFFSWFR